jgi:hypothetical protein
MWWFLQTIGSTFRVNIIKFICENECGKKGKKRKNFLLNSECALKGRIKRKKVESLTQTHTHRSNYQIPFSIIFRASSWLLDYNL